MRLLIPTIFAMSASLSACTQVDEVDTQRDIWLEHGGDSYQMVVQMACFCPNADPVTVQVVDGVLTEASVAVNGELQPIDSAEWLPHFTVDGLFDIAEDAAANADDATITYDPDLGYPVTLDIDWYTDAVDDEATYTVLDLQLTPAP